MRRLLQRGQTLLQVDRIVSLGGLCEVAYQARRLSRSGRAYPFDWWDTPFEGLLLTLDIGTVSALSAEHIVKVPRQTGRLPAFYSRLTSTVHQHEFPADTDFLAFSEEEIASRLAPKYAALEARLRTDCAAGITLFVRQCRTGHDPEGEALEAAVDRLHAKLAGFAADPRLLLVDYAVLRPRPWLIQAFATRHADATDLGSDRGWNEIFRDRGISCRGANDPFQTDDLKISFARAPSLLERLRRVLGSGA